MAWAAMFIAYIAVFTAYIATLIGGSYGVRVTRVEAESPLVVGEGGWLVCEWDLEGDTIYSVKWYLGLQEFFRYTPKSFPPIRVFPNKALQVDLRASNPGKVKLKNVSLRATGRYRCEVSGEAPTFHTEFKEATFTIVDFPDSKPVLEGVQSSYQLGDELHLNCTSPLSKPAAKLKFFVNDAPARDSWVGTQHVTIDPESGLETSSLDLHLNISKQIIREGSKLEIKCASSIEDLYWDTTVQNIGSRLPYFALPDQYTSSASAWRMKLQQCYQPLIVAALASILVHITCK